ncbi:hypothetical protein BH11PLA1_BH11PLA1_23320 [soil metagenome]
MHDESAAGNDYFKCDFCRRSWSDDLPMVEGHKGSLICARCVSAAYTQIIHLRDGEQGVKGPLKSVEADGPACTMCLERRAELYWRSPMYPEEAACRRCLRQAAGALEQDPDFGWKRPLPPPGAPAITDAESPSDSTPESEDD